MDVTAASRKRYAMMTQRTACGSRHPPTQKLHPRPTAPPPRGMPRRALLHPLSQVTTGDSVAAAPAAPVTGTTRRRSNGKAAAARLRATRSRGPGSSDDFVNVVSKAAQRRAKALEAAAVATDPAVPLASFNGSPRLTLAAALAKRPGVLAVRVNHRRNIVAADASTPACLSELLAIREVGVVPVTAREPADRRTSIGFVYGVDGDTTDAELLAGVISAVPVLSATREGATVKLRFAKPLPPERVALHGLRLRVRQVRPRPSQLPRHASALESASAAAADTRRPRAASPAASTAVGPTQLTPPPVLAGRRNVEWPPCWPPQPRRDRDGQSERRSARCYAALKHNLSGSSTEDLRHGGPASPVTPAEVARDTLIANLLATLQEAVQYMPEEQSLRATCLQAIGARPGVPRSE
ncbi:hypothetical protein HPB52_023321 [Rhipicephalus sanguineus]|uniref:Uncharacterized protein n=1 Tax=Rhipicephalus sanguineus TaxID=34632 RepID=A0A9D4QC05_RHISA|nr:hypothetical protein HPB52_023321 [Rhipicephalus sanguineus]